jgi:hypothetical protein
MHLAPARGGFSVEGLRFGSTGSRPKSLRGRFVLLTVLPPAVLGLTLLLLQEYVYQSEDPSSATARLILRVGGLVLCLLAVVLAAACGYLLVERITRPLRLLLRLAEDGELPASRAVGLQNRGPEVYELHRLVSVLVNQNKAGARALEELEQLRTALARLREDVARTGQHGLLPTIRPLPEGSLREVGWSLEAKRQQLQAFFRDLHERVAALRAEAAVLEEQTRAASVAEVPASPTASASAPDEAGGFEASGEALKKIQDSLRSLRELGTVWTLESARARGGPAELASRQFDRFQVVLEDLETELEDLPTEIAAHGNGGASPTPPASASAVPDSEEIRCGLEQLLEHLDALGRLLGEVEEK